MAGRIDETVFWLGINPMQTQMTIAEFFNQSSIKVGRRCLRRVRYPIVVFVFQLEAHGPAMHRLIDLATWTASQSFTYEQLK